MDNYRVKQLIDKVQRMEVNNMSKEEIQKSFTRDELDILKVAMAKIQKSEEDELDKGGEGSRGGKVIGHTKSGKPIYDSHFHQAHANFTSEEHKEKRGHLGSHLDKLETSYHKRGRDYMYYGGSEKKRINLESDSKKIDTLKEERQKDNRHNQEMSKK